MFDINEFRVIIAGSRDFDDYVLLKEKCDFFLSRKLQDPDCTVIIVSGHARGADTLGERYAQERGLRCEKYPADWDNLGKSAGMIRNKKMAEVSNCAIVFMSAYGENRGSQNMVQIAKGKGIPVRVVEEEP